MKSQKIADSCKNAMGTVFLLAGAFFVCSTLLSMRSVLADPIAPIDTTTVMGPQAGRAGATNRASGRTSPRNATSRATVARTAVAPVGNAATAPARSTVQSRAVRSRANARANAVPARNVISRTTAATTRANATTARSVRARTATSEAANNARISLQGSAIRGSKASPTSSYSYLNNKLYTGNYSNIIDSTTGLISADAYANCLDSYYTCMDEICTARSAAKRRCSCAARVTSFIEAENALETANEELIKVSGELALLVATEGKDVSAAFQLTDAEKIMNCAAYVEMVSGGADNNEITEWCSEHPEYKGGTVVTCSKSSAPTYCNSMGSTYGFDLEDLAGSGSDILASLKAWADAKDNSLSYLSDDEDNLLSAYENISGLVTNLTGVAENKNAELDSLANTWGYDLFEYAHDNVCGRVLDSCFNGIYEACGTPPSGGRCANGASSSCPYNYNSNIDVSSTGDVTLNERGSTSATTSTNATCFGYTSTSGDPYSSLRGPVADARRSIMQKYLLDANADCDAYGEELRATAQNIGYQKVAAQQALQQKRLEFDRNEAESVLTAATTAMSNFNECLSEIYECYVETEQSEKNWTSSRIKTYCAQIANIPHCYEEMICTPSGAQFTAVIDVEDSENCTNSQDYTANTCRNVVTLNEILNGAYTGSLADYSPVYGDASNDDSTKMREYCLRQAMGIPLDGTPDGDTWTIRNWKKDTSANK